MRKQIITISILTIFSVLFCTHLPCQGEDNTIYGCYKKNNGQLRIVNVNDQCLPSELPIKWNQTSTNQTSTEENFSPVNVFDSNEQYLGILLAHIGNIVVYVPSIKKIIQISTDNGDISNDHLFYGSNDCTGQPYGISNCSYKIFRNSGKYYTGLSLSPIAIIYHSKRNGYTDLCDTTSGYPVSAVEAIELPTLPFTVPFSLPLKFE